MLRAAVQHARASTKSDSELLIALVPRMVRTPDLDDLSYKGIASGNLNTVRLTYAPRQSAAGASRLRRSRPPHRSGARRRSLRLRPLSL